MEEFMNNKIDTIKLKRAMLFCIINIMLFCEYLVIINFVFYCIIFCYNLCNIKIVIIFLFYSMNILCAKYN